MDGEHVEEEEQNKKIKNPAGIVHNCNLDTCGVREERTDRGGGDGNRPTVYSISSEHNGH
jgi:hypothetical protein